MLSYYYYYISSYLFTYLCLSIHDRSYWTINRITHPLPEHASNAYLLRIMDVVLRKHLAYLCGLLYTFHVSSIKYYPVNSLPIPKICTLCGIFSAISVLSTTENWWSWNLGSGWVKAIEGYTSEFLTCHFLLVINCTRGRIFYRLWDIAFDRSTIALFCYSSCI